MEKEPKPQPQKTLHDAVRENLPGNQLSKEKFVSYDIPLSEGNYYIAISLTTDETETQMPEGVYVLAQTRVSSIHKMQSIATEIMNSLAPQIFKKDDTGYTDIPPEMSESLSKLGARVNLQRSISMTLVGNTDTGLLYRLSFVDLTGLKNMGVFDR
jgi:hypothetical protein